jgi:hypothetical protein
MFGAARHLTQRGVIVFEVNVVAYRGLRAPFARALPGQG